MSNFGGLFHFTIWGVYCLRGLRSWFAFVIDGLGLIVGYFTLSFFVLLCILLLLWLYVCYWFAGFRLDALVLVYLLYLELFGCSFACLVLVYWF